MSAPSIFDHEVVTVSVYLTSKISNCTPNRWCLGITATAPTSRRMPNWRAPDMHDRSFIPLWTSARIKPGPRATQGLRICSLIL